MKRPHQNKKRNCEDLDDYLFMPGNFDLNRLIINKIELRTGKVLKNLYFGGGHGHSVVISKLIGKGWILSENGAFITEFNSDTLKPINRIYPHGNMIGGHGACSNDGRRLYFVDRNLDEETIESSLIIYDIDKRKIIRKISDVGIFSHDVQITSDETLAIVASYGRVFYFVNQLEKAKLLDKYADVYKPSFSVIDIKTGKILKKEIFGNNFMLAHIAIDDRERVAYISGVSMWSCKRKTEEEVKSIIQDRGIALTFEEKTQGVIFSPSVQFKVDLCDLTVQKLESPSFYRTQTIVFSKKFKKIYETHSVSNRITVVDANSYRLKKVINCNELGISDPRGIILTQDEKFLIVTGRWNNIYFFDAEKDTFLKEKTLSSCNYLNSHICVSA